MKHRFVISRYYSFITSLYLLFLSVCIACQDYVTYNSVPIPIQPLSERGEIYFEQAQRVAEEGQHGFISRFPSDEQDGHRLEGHGGVGVSFHQGTFTGKTICDNYAITGGIDIFSIINIIPAVYEAVCRCIDINGWYYRHDKTEYIEDFLYSVDKARHTLYKQKAQDYYADAAYLKIKIYDLEVLIAACGHKKSSWRDACIEVRNILIKSLQYIELQCRHTLEEQCKIKQQVLRYAIEKVHKTTFKNKKDKQRLLTEYQDALVDEEKQYRAYQAAIAEQQVREKELQKQRYIQQAFTEQQLLLEDEARDSALYSKHIPLLAAAYKKRTAVLHQNGIGTGEYHTETYLLNDNVQVLLKNNRILSDNLANCYGNQYQQCLHQESLTVLEHASQIPINSLLYQHQQTIVTFAGVATDYNHAGECHKSVRLLDFCWTLLSWGTQIIEGAVEGAIAGVVGAVSDIIEHPVEAGVSVLPGSSVMLTYQLSKIVYTVADLGITTLIDYSAGKEKWDSYVEPINQLLDAIDKKQIGLKDVSKAVTQFGVQWYTQAKLLGGLRTFYDGIKNKVVLFLRTNPFAGPEQYFATPDGHLCKAAIQAVEQPVNECPASCINQYEKLKEALTIEQFTSIIKTTKHGIQRLIERGFHVKEVEDLVCRPHYVRAQFDGAKVFITNLSSDKYNLLVINEKTEEVVTALRNISFNRVEKLGNNYGWSLKG